MKFMFISTVTNDKYAGPSYSVPATIKWISKYEKVLWFNLLGTYSPEYENENLFYVTKDELKCIDFENLPGEFRKPDLVIFEDFYIVDFCRYASILSKKDIPYVIVPRGSLCKGAQKEKRIKKCLANFLLFKRFSRGAKAIQYLTINEQKDSGLKWNTKSFVIPNGIDILSISQRKGCLTRKGIKGVFIGRIDIHHKGLDLLVRACERLKSKLKQNNVTIEIYGPDSVGDLIELKQLINHAGLTEVLVIEGPAYDEKKTQVLLAADFFLLTSRYEGHPMGLLEALAYGLPALVTYGSNMGNEIRKANAGWVSETSVEGIIDSLSRMMDEKQNFEQYGNNARTLSERYSWDIIAKQLIEQLKMLCE